GNFMPRREEATDAREAFGWMGLAAGPGHLVGLLLVVRPLVPAATEHLCAGLLCHADLRGPRLSRSCPTGRPGGARSIRISECPGCPGAPVLYPGHRLLLRTTAGPLTPPFRTLLRSVPAGLPVPALSTGPAGCAWPGRLWARSRRSPLPAAGL